MTFSILLYDEKRQKLDFFRLRFLISRHVFHKFNFESEKERARQGMLRKVLESDYNSTDLISLFRELHHNWVSSFSLPPSTSSRAYRVCAFVPFILSLFSI